MYDNILTRIFLIMLQLRYNVFKYEGPNKDNTKDTIVKSCIII